MLPIQNICQIGNSNIFRKHVGTQNGRSRPGINSRWWFQIFLEFSPLFGEDFEFDEYFSDGLVQPPTSKVISKG